MYGTGRPSASRHLLFRTYVRNCIDRYKHNHIHQIILTAMAKKSSSGRILKSIKRGIEYIRQGHFVFFWKALRSRIYSQNLFFGLSRDLNRPFQPPDAKIDICIRPLQENDIESLLENGELTNHMPRLAAYQQFMVQTNIPTCYVAVTADGEPCYMQWLINSKENARIHDHFGETFPPLKDHEVLLEAAFMKRSFRGLRVMPAAMARIAEKGKDLGASRAITFVGSENIPALKGCRRAGFTPYILRKERWILFRQNISFSFIPKEMLEQYRMVVGGEIKQQAPQQIAAKEKHKQP